MKQVTFLPEDFDTLDYKGDKKKFNKQYEEPCDCPLARALKRTLNDDTIDISVGVCTIGIKLKSDNNWVNSVTTYMGHFGSVKVREVARRVSKNGKASFRFGTELKTL